VLFGEVAPKVLAHRYPDFFSRLSLPVVQLCWWLFAPIIKLFPNHKQDEPVSPTPLQSADAADILEGCEEVLDTQEETFLSRFLELGELRAGAMRRSMQDYLLLDRHLPLSLALRRMARARVPWAAVVDDHRQVIGVLDRTRLPQGRVVSDAMSTVPILPEVAPVAAGLKLLRDNGVPFILLVDEYGDSAGVIERGRWADTLLNRMPIAHTGLGKQVEEIADNRFLVDAAIALHEFADHFGEVQDGDVRVDTLAGYIQEKLGRIPAEGDEVPMATSTQKLMLKIASASETRILSIHLEVLT
jgi:CBS domain containing-hemolysin-like protein